MKNSGKVQLLILTFAFLGWRAGFINKKNIAKQPYSKLTLENYINRLKEFDISPEKEATNLFFDLLESGFHPNSAFDMVKKECIEAGEKFYD
jgi:hypothetical protein